MFTHTFVRHAFLAGTLIALASGTIGYVTVLRAQVFAGDALGHAAFTGALAAAAAGVDVRLGLFAATVVAGLALSRLRPRAQADDVTIGAGFAWVLGLGALFLSLFASGGNSTNASAGVRALFGSIYGLDTGAVRLSVAIAVGLLAGLALAGRPLLFSSIDRDIAAARGVPVAALGAAFLVLLGVATAEATQAVGALMALGLLAAPAGAAHRLAAGPYVGTALAGGIAVASMWIGLTTAYLVPSLPPSFCVIAVATLAFAASSTAPRTTRFPS